MNLMISYIALSLCFFKKKKRKYSLYCQPCDEFTYISHNDPLEGFRGRDIANTNGDSAGAENASTSQENSSFSVRESLSFTNLIDFNYPYRNKIISGFFPSSVKFKKYHKKQFEEDIEHFREGTSSFFRNLNHALKNLKLDFSENIISDLKKIKLSLNPDESDIEELYALLTSKHKYKEDIDTKMRLMNFLMSYKLPIIYTTYYYPEFYGCLLVSFANLENKSFKDICRMFIIYFSFFRTLDLEENQDQNFKCLVKKNKLKKKVNQLLDELYLLIYQGNGYSYMRHRLDQFKKEKKLSSLSPTLISLRLIIFFMDSSSIKQFKYFLKDLLIVFYDKKESYVKINHTSSLKILYGIEVILSNPYMNILIEGYYPDCFKNQNVREISKKIDRYMNSNDSKLLDPFLNLNLYGIRMLLPFFYFVNREFFDSIHQVLD